MAEAGIKYVLAQDTAHFNAGKKLFLEYVGSLGIDLSFQDFDKELLAIAEQYNKPGGALILLFDHEEPVGCIAVRKLEGEMGEIKRMYIRPSHRRAGYGKELVDKVLEVAFGLGYKTVRLDTLPDMEVAQRIYRDAGFYEIRSYRTNPIVGTVYMEKQLSADQFGGR